jgi:nitric oxide reductase activation protein
MQAFGQGLSRNRKTSSFWNKSDEVEGFQVFSNSRIQREKENKILGKLKEDLEHTKFKSIEIPPQDYTEYRLAKKMVGGSSRRLLSNIMMATNLEFEDIRKMYGVLDLSDAVQVVASKSDRNDVFMRDELLKKSFSLAVLIDVSRSMGVSPVENRALAVCIADVAASFVTESTSCAIYAFSDKLYVLKDSSETFSKTVQSRIGGVPFDGATYMPDAINAAANFLKKSSEEQRIIVILSDGFPYGYSEIYEELSETNEKYETAGMIIMGIGLGTEKMSDLFRYNASVYTQKDLINNVARLLLKAYIQELGS